MVLILQNNGVWDDTWERMHIDSPRPFLEYKMSLIKPFLEVDGDKCALDVGCGDGFFTINLLNLCYKIDAIDVSLEAVNATRRRAKNHEFLNNLNLFNIDISEFKPEYKYDLILCLEVLEHIKDDKRTLNLFNSWLKKDGILVLSVPHRQNLWNYTDDIGGHYRRYSKQELINKLISANFEVENIFDYGFPFIRFFANKLCAPAEKRAKSKINPPKNNFFVRITSTMLKNMCKIDSLFLNNNRGIDIISISKKF